MTCNLGTEKLALKSKNYVMRKQTEPQTQTADYEKNLESAVLVGIKISD